LGARLASINKLKASRHLEAKLKVFFLGWHMRYLQWPVNGNHGNVVDEHAVLRSMLGFNKPVEGNAGTSSQSGHMLSNTLMEAIVFGCLLTPLDSK